ncbi:DNA-processing protein DprA [Fusobacterium sp. MFO224]|uniref:DNA-processing protein DprA n=1 Tax=Fusobacterium sp. MFO224 TaxID=3378070 RepID=UPI003853277F
MDWYRLRLVNLKDNVILSLMKRLNCYDEIFKLSKEQLKIYFFLKDKDIAKIYESRKIDLNSELEILKRNNINIISLKDENYPIYLKNISHPPVFLYYMGNINLLKTKIIGIVGTRKPTTYGKICCEKFTNELVNSGVTTISGLALGIDVICHKTTLNLKGNTIAVVGSGLDIIYPYENKKYWNEISQYGLILSEFPLGTKPLAYNFPMRNRIIAGISKGILVVESKEKGGSLITASLAIEEGRDVFAVPGDIYSPVSVGTNNLIKKSEAKLVTCGKDILKEFNWEYFPKENNLNLTKEENIVYNNLTTEKNLDELILSTGMKANILLALLINMEIKNAITSVSGGKYRRKNK